MHSAFHQSSDLKQYYQETSVNVDLTLIVIA